MEDKVCLDTDFLVNFLRNKPAEADFIEQHELHTIFSTTAINLFELYFGAYKSGIISNVLKVEELEARLQVLPASPEAMKMAGEILAALEKSGQPLDFRDLLIGCIVLTEKCAIKTNNKRHFERIPSLIVI